MRNIVVAFIVLIMAAMLSIAVTAQVSAECEAGFRLFDHELLVSDAVCIPESPERIAALDRFSFEMMLALGVEPVAASSFALALTRDLPYLEDLVVDVVDLGQPPNIELLLDTQPDLILSITGYGEYEQLAGIAPTVQIDFAESGAWQAVADAFGQAAGLEAETAQIVSDYEARLNIFAETVGDPSALAVSVIRVRPDSINIYTTDHTSSFLGVILGDAGLAVPEQQAELAETTDFVGDISIEQLPLIDADVLLIWTFATNDDAAANASTALDELRANPLWSAIPVVQNNETHVVGGYWIGSSYHAAHAVIDDLFTYVADVDPAEVAPNPLVNSTDQEVAAACEAGFRLFDHEYLATEPVCIPEDPQRVITLDQGIMTNLIALGAPPVGVHDWGVRDFAPYVNSEMVVSVGTTEGPSLERMLTLDPDLIVAKVGHIDWYGEDFIATLQEIAPVILTDTDTVTWEEEFLLHGAMLNQADAAQSLLDAYTQRLAEFREVTANQDTTIAIIRSRADAFNIYVGDYFIVDVVQEAGLRFPEPFADLPSPNSISLEEIDMLDSDYLFVMVRNEDEGDYFREASEGPLWAFLPAVQQDQVYQVDWSTWVAGWNIVGAHLVVDDLFGYFTDTTSTTPNPFADLLTGTYAPADMSQAVCEMGFRDVIDATGAVVCLPEEPQRIVALSEVDIDALLALGVDPIAVTNGRGQAAPPRYLSASLPESVVSTGTFFQPNLEIILEQQPDLILFAGFTDPDVLAQLNVIAPVYNAATFAESWQVHLTRLGEALGMNDEVAAIIGNYEMRVSGLRELLGSDVAGEFVVARWAAEGPQIMAPRTLSSSILMDLGFTPPVNIPELQEGHAHTPPLSLEALDIVDVDWAFVGTLQGEGDAVDALDETLESPLFQSLNIVRNNRVFVVDGSIWTSVGGFIGAMAILDDIEAAMLGDAS